MSRNYVVVADAARARVLTCDARLDTLEEVADLIHPESRLHHADLVTDQAGRRSGDSTEGPDAQQHAQEEFSREVAEHLRDARNQGRFDRLILVAPPRFLGLLRKALDGPTQQTVVASVNHDLTLTPLHELPAAIRRHLPSVPLG
jgi:protein required for attachment to host cells